MRQKQIFEKILVELHEMRIALQMLVPNNTVLLPNKENTEDPSKTWRWTEDEVKRLIREINSGKTYSQLMTIFPGRSHASLQTKACDLRKEKKIKKDRIRTS